MHCQQDSELYRVVKVQTTIPAMYLVDDLMGDPNKNRWAVLAQCAAAQGLVGRIIQRRDEALAQTCR